MYQKHINPYKIKSIFFTMRRRKISVGDVMTRNFISVSPNTNLRECIKVLVREKVNNLLITSNKRLVGVLTTRDILKILAKNSESVLDKTPVKNVATRKIAVIEPSAELSQAVMKMKTYGFRRLPVVSRGEVVGIITLKDILSIEPGYSSELQYFLDIREEERKIKEANSVWPAEGLCENCGAFSELLKVNGRLLCYDCRADLF